MPGRGGRHRNRQGDPPPEGEDEGNNSQASTGNSTGSTGAGSQNQTASSHGVGDVVKRKRTLIRTRITNICTEMDRILVTDPVDKDKLEDLLQKIEIRSTELRQLDEEILDKMLSSNAEDNELDHEEQTASNYEDKIIEARRKAKHIQNQNQTAQASQPTSNSAELPQVSKVMRYDKFKPFKYDGSIGKWITWWSQFEKYHKDSGLTDAEKYHYLLQYTEEDSLAKEIVTSGPQSAALYPEVIASLQNRCGRQDILQDYYVRELQSLTQRANKNNLTVTKLYDKLKSNISCLSSLGINSEALSTLLLPTLEGALPRDVMMAWQRSPHYRRDGTTEDPKKTRLDILLEFMDEETIHETRMGLLLDHTGNEEKSSSNNSEGGKRVNRNRGNNRQDRTPTVAGLAATSKPVDKCLFCNLKNHKTEGCRKAKRMTAEDKRQKLINARACFKCFSLDHFSNQCDVPVSCGNCGGAHNTQMCRGGGTRGQPRPEGPSNNPTQVDAAMMGARASNPALIPPRGLGSMNYGGGGQTSHLSVTHHANLNMQQTETLLKVVVVRVVGPRGQKTVRLLVDEGSQVSYIGGRTVHDIGAPVMASERVQNELLGGYVTEICEQNIVEAEIRHLGGAQSKKFLLREKPIVCTSIPRVPYGPWVDKLKKKGIHLPDLNTAYVDETDIEIIIGSDLRGEIMTGKRIDLGENLIAEETIFGWSLGGPIQVQRRSTNFVASLFSQHRRIEDLWSLESLGIQDPIKVKTKGEKEEEAMDHFLQNVKRGEDGRYQVALPWITSSPELPSYHFIAEKRLQTVTNKLMRNGKFGEYEKIFSGWEDEQFIKVIQLEDLEPNHHHFIPHHPVFKASSKTTPIRPVFDASFKIKGRPSLNDCLYSGPNLIELIPSVLIRFQEGNIGVVSDIRKAFQMLEVRDEDRPYLLFLWWEDHSRNEVKILQHQRVVFGLRCSPFLLGATLKFHLSNVTEESRTTAQKLMKSLYVDNNVTSVENDEEYEEYKSSSSRMIMEAKMELREWERSWKGSQEYEELEGAGLVTGVLGLIWNKKEDTLCVGVEPVIIGSSVSKKRVLSEVAKVFDPMGWVCPATLQLKLLLQDSWKLKKDWEDELSLEHEEIFLGWCREAHKLGEIKVPRQMMFSTGADNRQLHVFTDASMKAYGACVFVRTTIGDIVRVQLVQAKARVAPIKDHTIPRLELLGCLTGARLLQGVTEAMDKEIHQVFLWSDSTVALAWIKNGDEFGTFVGNRVEEIRRLTSPDLWKFVPGPQNPADLPSRGCSPSDLLETRWFEGPSWLYETEEYWPNFEVVVDEEEYSKEMKKTRVTLLSTVKTPGWFQTNFSSYHKNVKVMAWVKRFVTNTRESKKGTMKSRRVSKIDYHRLWVTIPEYKEAELELLRCLQGNWFNKTTEMGKLNIVEMDGLLRVVTRLTHSKEDQLFRYPIILPPPPRKGKEGEPLVRSLIYEAHLNYGHPTLQFLRCKLRERLWVPGGRRSINSVIRHCPKCKRYQAQPVQVVQAPLPMERVTVGEVFDTTGVDLTGPLKLKDGKKAWVIIFTCAVYRCVHFDVTTSLSTEAFLQALERFVNHYGRPLSCWSDHGTNFIGAAGLMKALDWKRLEEDLQVKMIKWRFNPPAAPWHGGMWERMIRTMKTQLRKTLGNGVVDYDELRTCLSNTQATINDRPLTIMTEDDGDLTPITPAMFLHPTRNSQFPEGEEMRGKGLGRKYKKMRTIIKQLQTRFRREYLSLLIQSGSGKNRRMPKVGDLVLIGSDDKKRFEWPLGRITELIPGRDGQRRTAKVQTAHDYTMKKGKCGRVKVIKVKKGSILERAVQRLYPLELELESNDQLRPPVNKMKIVSKSKEVKQNRGDKKDDEEEEEAIPPAQVTRSGRRVQKPNRYDAWNYK